MESELRTDENHSSQLKKSDHLKVNIGSNDENIVTKVDHKDSVKKKRISWFQWIQLIATILTPVIIGVYTIVENNSSLSIADSNRRKDVEIANISRASEFEIEQSNRLNEIIIAEKSREKDRELALDEQRQNVLIAYQTFLANLIIDNGVTLNLNKSPAAKLVGRFMTITALSQLDAARKSIVLRSLFETRLINLERKSKPSDTSILDLQRVDLTDTTFNVYRYSAEETPTRSYNLLTYLWLPRTILTNASFRYAFLDCSVFEQSRMDSADFSFVICPSNICFDGYPEYGTDFSSTSLVNANFYNAGFVRTDFSKANLTLANMRYFTCRDCTFSSAVFVLVDLSFSNIYGLPPMKQTATFFSAQLRQVVAHSATFRVMNFTSSNWLNVQASGVILEKCIFSYVTMKNCSFIKSNIKESNFRNTSLYDIDISHSILYNVSFINSDMFNTNFSFIQCDYCNFINVQLQEAIFKNASFRYSNFLNSRINISYLIEEAIDLTGTTLPNGTVVV